MVRGTYVGEADESVLDRQGDGVGAVAGVQLRPNIGQVELDRVLRYVEIGGDVGFCGSPGA